MKRLSKLFGFEMKDGIPLSLLNMPKESLLELLHTVSVNWLAKARLLRLTGLKNPKAA